MLNKSDINNIEIIELKLLIFDGQTRINNYKKNNENETLKKIAEKMFKQFPHLKFS